jgi:VanZ family protein
VWFARRPALLTGVAAVGVAYGITVLTLAEMPAERVHLLEYGAVGWLACRAMRHRFAGRDHATLSALLVLNIGLGDELIQGLIPRRYYDQKDVLVNGVAGILAVVAVHLLRAATAPREAAR